MDDLLREFLTETAENLAIVDVELVRFERDPNDAEILAKVFRLVHTIKGTCGFLGLPRLEAVAHAGETLLGKFRDRVLPVTPQAVTLVLESLDRIKAILADLEAQQQEPQGDDSDIISRLEAAAAGALVAATPEPEAAGAADGGLGRPLKPGEVPLDELEAAFLAAPGPEDADRMPAAAEAAAPKPAETRPAEAKPAEAAPGEPKESAVAHASIRVNVDVLEDLMTMVSELVLTRNQLLEMVRRLDNSEFKVPLQRLSNVTAELQEGVMKTRMQPIGNAWQKLPRIVRDLANELGKKIELQMIGAETELDRQVLELIKDPLTHMVRNSGDHGIEDPATRRAAGKPELGTITLRAFHEGGHIIIEVSDDGRGLDANKIRAKAIEKGLISAADAERMTEQQLQKFIFAPGFYTAAKVTNISGRGVGMDVVRTNIEQIGGQIDLKSVAGKGSSFTIKIPLTLAIISALIVEASGQRFAIPQLAVIELVRARTEGTEHRIERINGTPVLRLRDRLLPLVSLAEMLGIGSGRTDEGYVIVMRVGAQTFGAVVDNVFDTQEIVVKPAASLLREIDMFSGNTILGDGSVIMIIDPNGAAAAVGRTDGEKQDGAADAGQVTRKMDEDRGTFLLFRAGGEEPKAVPLGLVTRLEEIEAERIEPSNGQYLVQYRGKLMPIMHAAGMPLACMGRQPVIVFTQGDATLGVAVDQIVDIVEDRLTIEVKGARPGIVGSAVIRGKATEVVDVGYYLEMAGGDWYGSAKPEAKRARRILLIDQSPFFRTMMTPLLAAAGYEVTSTGPGDAQLILEQSRFDCILSDIDAPESVEALEAAVAAVPAPVVALSTARDRFVFGSAPVVHKSDRHSLIATVAETLARPAADAGADMGAAA